MQDTKDHCARIVASLQVCTIDAVAAVLASASVLLLCCGEQSCLHSHTQMRPFVALTTVVSILPTTLCTSQCPLQLPDYAHTHCHSLLCNSPAACLQASYHEINSSGVRFKMKDRLVKDSGPGCSASGLSLLLQNRCHRYSHLCIGCAENIDQKAHKFRGDLELTVVECFDLPGSPSKDSADVGDKWEVSVTPAEYSEGPPAKSQP